MDEIKAGWYPDPSGDASKLRYWDGQAWTDQYLPTQTSASNTASQAQQTPYSATQPDPAAASAYQAQSNPSYTQQPYQAAQPQATYVEYPQSNTTNIYIQTDGRLFYPDATYPMTSTDRTLRQIAFIWNIFCLACSCWFIIPLAWQIPMLVRSWGIYKGTKPNTVAFGVCNLLFFGFVSGVLLLCSNKDQ